MQAIVRHLSDPEDLWLELWGVADGPEAIPDVDNDPDLLREICLDEATFRALSALTADSEPVTVRVRLELVVRTEVEAENKEKDNASSGTS